MTLPDNTDQNLFHSDIRRGDWVDRVLPRELRPYARLARLDRPIGTWLLLLPGLWGVTAAAGGIENFQARDWVLFVLFGIGALVMRGAGCAINDLWDRDLDAKVERTKSRPLAAGDLTPRQGLAFLGLLLGIGFAILIQLSSTAICLGLAAAGMVVIYPLAKRVTWYPQAMLGLTFNMGALMGWAAVTGSLAAPAVCLYAAGLLWTLGYDTIYAHQDKQDDALVGIRSTALKFGTASPRWIAGFYAGASILVLSAGVLLGAEQLFFVIWALSCFHFIHQLYIWDMNDAVNCLRVFRSNRDYALLVLAAFALGFIHM